jgi:hypothetical protein
MRELKDTKPNIYLPPVKTFLKADAVIAGF